MRSFRFIVSVGIMMLFFLLAGVAFVYAQQTSEPPEQTLQLDDEFTGVFVRGDRLRYTLNLKDANEPVDVVLFSSDNGTMYVYDEQGKRIRTVERMNGYGFEVFTWELADKVPAQIEISFTGNSGDYSVSVRPKEQQVSADPKPGEQVKRWAEFEVGQANKSKTSIFPYLLYVPEDYDPTQKYPFILFMHGLGETGPRLDFLTTQVIPKLIEDGQDFPFIIASPHLNYGEYWESEIDVVGSFVKHLQSEFPIDPNRIYITGLSLGGAGAWHFAFAFPDVPAALVPMAGWYSYGSTYVPKNICDLAKIPTWVFHGGKDEVVKLAWEQALVDGLKKCGSDVKFTIYPDADHSETFEQGFADPALYVWLLQQHK